MKKLFEIVVGSVLAAIAAAVVISLARRLRTPSAVCDFAAGSPTPASDKLVAEKVARDVGHPARMRDAAQRLPDVLIDPQLVVEKGLRTLTLLSSGLPVKQYCIALGFEPVGDKKREGDGRTPEGRFFICSKNRASKYHRSLGLSYPAPEHAERALADGTISKRELRSILDAHRRMQCPPWKTLLGGEITLHGGGSTRGDWTRGGIALDDEDVEELFTALPLGAPVEILP